ncbi:XRE family transcriptional regulator [Actinomadura spongiicola]|uniref:XRE family transcriptional regulator n=1 Tax=Actinomadura spongiicola TaxID=2303421 RepID=A0A372G9Z5_9ACTN|nr:helix-turn-helix transcriptional regulator [Actinomadura spongiicola]RFS82208.1 XRE family transcriptional regulator [Actinomadura spongiicola]
MPRRGKSVPRRRQRPRESPALIAFGRQLRRMREAQGTKQETIAHLTNLSGAQVSRIEGGKRRATRTFVELVDDHLAAGGALISLWEDLNKDGHPVPIWFDWPQIEGDASEMTYYQLCVIAGMAQSPSYAAAILDGNEDAVAARLERQKIIDKDDAPTITFLVDEQALYRQVGTAETMREQLEHLLMLSERSNVTVQVVLSSGEHGGNGSSFVIATMADRSQVAYVETAIRGLTTDDPADLAAAARVLADLRNRTLPGNMSRDLIRKVAEERWT